MNVKKILSVAVILLFIGLAVAPSINANVSKETLVEFTTEVCGLDGGKQTVKLTQKEAQEVEALFDSIRTRLNATDSREDAEGVFKEAVVELDKYGLLGGLSVKQAQRLLSFYNAIQRSNSVSEMSDNENAFCEITGKIDNAHFVGPLSRPAVYISFIAQVMNLPSLPIILFVLTTFASPFLPLFPLRLGSLITFGYWYDYGVSWGGDYSHGWIITNGSNGLKEWHGRFDGGLYSFSCFPFHTYYVGVEGFYGLRIIILNIDDPPDSDSFILGFARRVGITKYLEYP